jgi:hypothetical protein
MESKPLPDSLPMRISWAWMSIICMALSLAAALLMFVLVELWLKGWSLHGLVPLTALLLEVAWIPMGALGLVFGIVYFLQRGFGE